MQQLAGIGTQGTQREKCRARTHCAKRKRCAHQHRNTAPSRARPLSLGGKMAKELVNPLNTLKALGDDPDRRYYSLPALEEATKCTLARLPYTVRIMLESLLRNCDGKKIKEEDVLRLAHWGAKKEGKDVPFAVSRVILQDFTGVPLLVDLAAMRDAVAAQKKDPRAIEPIVPVDLVIDHSVQVDRAGTDDSFLFNLKLEFERNRERYAFLKWGEQAFETFKVVPPGIGIVHQVNLEHIATVVTENKERGLLYFDTLVGTDSHTTMINGLGVLGWGVGGIEAEAAMLGQPMFIPMPEVIGFHLHGKLREGVTATDLTLRITEMLRKEKVVDKFVEFCGDGAASLTVADRATISNMCPEYGATASYFPVDEKTLEYLRTTGRSDKHIQAIRTYLEAQKLFGVPKKGEITYSKLVELDLNDVAPCVSGPKRPQDRIDLKELKQKWQTLLAAPVVEGGYGRKEEEMRKSVAIHSNGSFTISAHHETGGIATLEEGRAGGWSEEEMVGNKPVTSSTVNPGYCTLHPSDAVIRHGSVVIAAITSCTNTSNPAVMLGAGLLAKKAVERGLKVNPFVKTSLAPGSRVVTDYLQRAGVQKYLDELGFHLVAYGCTTCIGNSGPLDETIETAIKENNIVSASVLSGNRNFEARIHSSVRANFLMSPALVVAFALAGTVNIDMAKDPLGVDPKGNPVFLKDVWPSSQEIQECIAKDVQPQMFKKRYAHILKDNPIWEEVEVKKSAQYNWDPESTYIQQPPFFEGFTVQPKKEQALKEMRILALFGDSITTDHISPAGAFSPDSPAGKYLLSHGVKRESFNSYGSRRGNHNVMMRGTFGNVRIRNRILEDKEGGWTKCWLNGEVLPIFDACMLYAKENVPLIVFAGRDYGMGSSRDWAAKGTLLLGVRAVVASSFERIHRSNLVGMGVWPLQFQEGDSWESLKLNGEEAVTLSGWEKEITPGQTLTLEIHRGGNVDKVPVLSRLDSPVEVDYYLNGGILPYVLRQVVGQ